MNLKELAAEFGVSPSTISRVVNQSKNFSVSAELRGRILARAAELGYAPNPMYQAMRKKDNRQISILFPYLLHIMGGADISKGIDCLSEELFRLGYSSHYLSCPQEQRRNYGVPPWKVAGAVAVDVRLPGQIAELDASGIPYVSLNGIAGPNGASVLVDERANTFLLLDYLYGLGHR
ncbi:MAG: LacI family DNA-binding transcriptional regulator, partial [Victivallis vadensis]